MAQCSYRHNAFGIENTYRSRGNDECWVPLEVKYFEVEGTEVPLCTLHAPLNAQPLNSESQPVEQRPARQAEALQQLLQDWQKKGNQGGQRSAFRLPGIHCGKIDLQGFNFNGEVNFENASFGEIFLHKAIFFEEAKFNSARFQENTNFNEATFQKEADFRGAMFSKAAEFNGSRFGGVTQFSGAKFDFGRSVEFRDAIFGGYTIFDNASGGTVDFSRAEFKEVVTFGEAHFLKAGFFTAIFRKDVTFGLATFDTVSFDAAVFHEGVQFVEISAVNASLRRVDFRRASSLFRCKIGDLVYSKHTGESLSFFNCRALQVTEKPFSRWDFTNQDCSRLEFVSTDLSRAHFLGAQIFDTRFESCSWSRNRNQRYAKVGDHDGFFKGGTEDEGNLKLLQALYQKLKTNLEQEAAYSQSGEFHYWEMWIRQRLLAQGGGPWLEKMFLWAYGAIADFGESYKKLLISLLASFPIAALIVAIIEGGWGLVVGEWQWCRQFRATCILDPLNNLWAVSKVVVFGVIPSGFQRTTLGDTNLTVGSMGVIVLEGVAAIALATLFVMAIRRQFRR